MVVTAFIRQSFRKGSYGSVPILDPFSAEWFISSWWERYFTDRKKQCMDLKCGGALGAHPKNCWYPSWLPPLFYCISPIHHCRWGGWTLRKFTKTCRWHELGKWTMTRKEPCSLWLRVLPFANVAAVNDTAEQWGDRTHSVFIVLTSFLCKRAPYLQPRIAAYLDPDSR